MNEKKNILFVSSWYPNRLNATLGIFVKRHAQAVALYHNVSSMFVCSDANIKNKHDVDVVNEEGILTVRVYYQKVTSKTPLVSQIQKFNRNKKAYSLAYAEVLKQNGKPDIVHANVLSISVLFAYLISKKLKVPFVFTEHWTGYLKDDGAYKGFFLKLIARYILNKAQYILPVSSDLKKAMQLHHISKPIYEVIPNVVDSVFFNSINIVKDTNTIRAIHVSSLDEKQKNVSGIIKAAAIVYKKYKNFELVIVGDGPDKNNLETIAEHLQVLNKAVFFVGSKYNKDLVSEFNRSDFFVLFSNYENLPCVLLEALCVGIPIISSSVGGVSEIINSKNGVLIKKGNVDDLVNKINFMIENKEIFNVVQIKNDALANFSIQVIGNKIDAIYNKLLNA